MTYSTIIGLILTSVGLLLFIMLEPDYTYKEFYTASILSLGVGLLLGGFMGYAQKKRKKIVQPKFEHKEEGKFKSNKTQNESGLKL